MCSSGWSRPWRSEFGLKARIVRQAASAPSVVVASKTLVEFLHYLGCGGAGVRQAHTRRRPAVTRDMVLAFLQGLALDAYV